MSTFGREADEIAQKRREREREFWKEVDAKSAKRSVREWRYMKEGECPVPNYSPGVLLADEFIKSMKHGYTEIEIQEDAWRKGHGTEEIDAAMQLAKWAMRAAGKLK